ncbi:MAG TPA: hypothetical protein VGD59_12585 [Acidisarcina sp.]
MSNLVRGMTRDAGGESGGSGERPRASSHDSEPDADVGKGAVEDDQPHARNQTTLSGQLGHRSNSPQSVDPQSSDAQWKESDTDFPEPGSSPEHSGQHR